MALPGGWSILRQLLGWRAILLVRDFFVARALFRFLMPLAEYRKTGSALLRLESSLALTLDESPVVGLNSGSDALVLALKVIGVGDGDEVVVPAFGCAILASSVLWVNAKPVFADVREDDYGIAPESIEKKITKRTKAVIVAHLFGQPTSGMEEILRIARRHNITVIEDGAQAFGARVYMDSKWQSVGTIGNIGCFSFSFGKPFSGAGKGGALTTKDERLIERALQMRAYGAKEAYVNYPEVGINMKLDDLHASVLLAKLPFYEYSQRHKDILARRYKEKLLVIKEILLPQESANTKRIWHYYVVRAKDRDGLLAFLKDSLHTQLRLHVFIPYPVLLPHIPLFGGAYKGETFPGAVKVSEEILSLPLSDALSLSDVELVCKLITDFYRQSKLK